MQKRGTVWNGGCRAEIWSRLGQCLFPAGVSRGAAQTEIEEEQNEGKQRERRENEEKR